MGIRSKLFLVFFACGVVPMLILAVANYMSGVGAVEEMLRQEIEREARVLSNNVEAAQREQETGLAALARSRSLRDYVSGATKETSSAREGQPRKPEASGAATPSSVAPGGSGLKPPADVRADVEAFLLANQNDYAALACLDTQGRPLFRVELGQRETTGESVRYQTEDILPSSIAPDPNVWTTPESAPIRSTLAQENSGANVRYAIPIFIADAAATPRPRGALVADLKLNAMCKRAVRALVAAPGAQRLLLVLEGRGRVVYYTNEAQLYQPVADVLPPSFKAIADSMVAGESGQKIYDSEEGERWVASYRPVLTSGLSVTVAGNDTLTLQSFRQTALRNILLSALAGVLTAILLTLIARRMERSIERVTAGAVAIAGGQLDQRIEVRSSDETRLLAESFNRMSDRLREQIAREAETRQFESFMRLSAMLTHDLKNAITALSLFVSNMEVQFDNEEFRAEAIESLKGSTDKLRSLVAKLSGPVESLSGEYQRPRPTDLVPYLRRVLAATAEQAQPPHQIKTNLPQTLVATVDAERIEKVFENLIINALEAMGTESGTLSVEGGPESDTEIFFSITDTGPGMSDEFQRTRLFRAFATTKRKGVGLGLYTCREVVRAHGGRIEVKSEKGAGATFRVVLPSARFTEGD